MHDFDDQSQVPQKPTSDISQTENSSSRNKGLYFSTPQLVMISIVAAVFSVIALLNQALTDLARVLLGFYGAMAFGGLFQTPGILAYALIGKRGTAFVTQNLFGLTQVAIGNPAGFIVLWFTLAEAVAQELLFIIWNPRRADKWYVWAAGGVVSWIGAQIPNYFLFGFGEMSIWSWLLPIIVVGIPSSILIPVTFIKSAIIFLPSNIRTQLVDKQS